MSFFYIPLNHIFLYFSFNRAHKTIVIPLFSDSEAGNLYGMSNGAILDIGIVSIDLNKIILKFDDFFKHDISELTACSRLVNPVFFKVEIKIFKVVLNL